MQVDARIECVSDSFTDGEWALLSTDESACDAEVAVRSIDSNFLFPVSADSRSLGMRLLANTWHLTSSAAPSHTRTAV